MPPQVMRGELIFASSSSGLWTPTPDGDAWTFQGDGTPAGWKWPRTPHPSTPHPHTLVAA